MNELTLGNSHALDQYVRPIKIGGELSTLETSLQGNGTRINGDLELLGNLKTINSTEIDIDSSGNVRLYAGSDVFIDSARHIDITPTNNVNITAENTMINCDITNTSGATYSALTVDMDKTEASTSTNIVIGVHLDIDNATATNGFNYMYGIYSTTTLTHAADAGAPVVYGGYFAALGGTNGSSASKGMYLLARDSDANQGLEIVVPDGADDYHIKLTSLDDTGDYCLIKTADTGATTIMTVDDSNSETAHLTLDIQGDTIFKGDIADGTSTEVCRVDASASSLLMASTNKIEFNSASNYIYASGASDMVWITGRHTTIQPAGQLFLDSGGEIHLDSATGQFVMKNNGTEFSVEDSAYAGMILGYTQVYDPDSVMYQGITTSFVNMMKNFDSADHYLKVTFVVPPSNKVRIECSFHGSGMDGTMSLGLATDTSATSLAAIYELAVWDVDESDGVTVNHGWTVDGSGVSWSAGQSKTLYVMVKEGSAGGRIWLGGFTNAWTMTAIALPASIGDGT